MSFSPYVGHLQHTTSIISETKQESTVSASASVASSNLDNISLKRSSSTSLKSNDWKTDIRCKTFFSNPNCTYSSKELKLLGKRKMCIQEFRKIQRLILTPLTSGKFDPTIPLQTFRKTLNELLENTSNMFFKPDTTDIQTYLFSEKSVYVPELDETKPLSLIEYIQYSILHINKSSSEDLLCDIFRIIRSDIYEYDSSKLSIENKQSLLTLLRTQILTSLSFLGIDNDDNSINRDHDLRKLENSFDSMLKDLSQFTSSYETGYSFSQPFFSRPSITQQRTVFDQSITEESLDQQLQVASLVNIPSSQLLIRGTTTGDGFCFDHSTADITGQNQLNTAEARASRESINALIEAKMLEEISTANWNIENGVIDTRPAVYNYETMPFTFNMIEAIIGEIRLFTDSALDYMDAKKQFICDSKKSSDTTRDSIIRSSSRRHRASTKFTTALIKFLQQHVFPFGADQGSAKRQLLERLFDFNFHDYSIHKREAPAKIKELLVETRDLSILPSEVANSRDELRAFAQNPANFSEDSYSVGYKLNPRYITDPGIKENLTEILDILNSNNVLHVKSSSDIQTIINVPFNRAALDTILTNCENPTIRDLKDNIIDLVESLYKKDDIPCKPLRHFLAQGFFNANGQVALDRKPEELLESLFAADDLSYEDFGDTPLFDLKNLGISHDQKEAILQKLVTDGVVTNPVANKYYLAFNFCDRTEFNNFFTHYSLGGDLSGFDLQLKQCVKKSLKFLNRFNELREINSRLIDFDAGSDNFFSNTLPHLQAFQNLCDVPQSHPRYVQITENLGSIRNEFDRLTQLAYQEKANWIQAIIMSPSDVHQSLFKDFMETDGMDWVNAPNQSGRPAGWIQCYALLKDCNIVCYREPSNFAESEDSKADYTSYVVTQIFGDRSKLNNPNRVIHRVHINGVHFTQLCRTEDYKRYTSANSDVHDVNMMSDTEDSAASAAGVSIDVLSESKNAPTSHSMLQSTTSSSFGGSKQTASGGGSYAGGGGSKSQSASANSNLNASIAQKYRRYGVSESVDAAGRIYGTNEPALIYIENQNSSQTAISQFSIIDAFRQTIGEKRRYQSSSETPSSCGSPITDPFNQNADNDDSDFLRAIELSKQSQ
ncbi:hypothetical protein DID75_01240 [Candidatus Marinamargulisbacteria bacterium SCGC AG-410-N11]|nr:hypothetical protein DID75_01240 [Candidatus Marinamargulisbacteria bacterium SCGC AG-410-N11]